MKEKIKKFVKERNALVAELKKWVVDKSISLEERWNTFIESDLGDCEDGEFDGIDWNQHTFYDDFNMDRGAVSRVEDLLETALDDELFEEGGEEAFKEYCLKNFCKEIRNEW